MLFGSLCHPSNTAISSIVYWNLIFEPKQPIKLTKSDQSLSGTTMQRNLNMDGKAIWIKSSM